MRGGSAHFCSFSPPSFPLFAFEEFERGAPLCFRAARVLPRLEREGGRGNGRLLQGTGTLAGFFCRSGSLAHPKRPFCSCAPARSMEKLISAAKEEEDADEFWAEHADYFQSSDEDEAFDVSLFIRHQQCGPCL